MGKHFVGFNKIKSATYHKIEDAQYPDYEDWDDFFWDTLKENWDYFLNCELTLEQVSDVIYHIYSWCREDKVILDNDCSNTASTWTNWKETGDIVKILEGLRDSKEVNNEIFQECLEENHSVLFSNPSYSNALIGISTDGKAIYDYDKMIEELSSEDDISYEEAAEFIDYNTIGSLPPSESKYPIIMYNKKMYE